MASLYTSTYLMDWWYGRRDGKAGMPRPGRVSLSTPYRDRLIALAGDEYERNRLAYKVTQAATQRRIADWLAKLHQAEAEVARARTKAADLASGPNEAAVNPCRPGEEQRPEQLVRFRRRREHDRKLKAAAEAVSAAEAKARNAERALASDREQLRKIIADANGHIRLIHVRWHERLAWYRKGLIQHHPQAGLVAQAMDLFEPGLPEWLDDETGAEPLPPTLDPPLPSRIPAAAPTGQSYPITGTLAIGSSARRADVVLSGYGIAASHAVVKRYRGGVLLQDLGRGSGTFQAGQPVRRVRLAPGADFDIGNYRFHVHANGDRLIKTHIGGFGLVVSGLSSHKVAGNRLEPTLNRVSFTQPAGTVLAILEPFCSGSSVLLPALLGEAPSSGALHFQGINMRTRQHQVRAMTGFVRRRPMLHETWTVHRELAHTDRIRRPSDVRRNSSPLRDPRAEACQLLGLGSLLGKKVKSLSAEQRRRLSTAIEVLARPRLLLVDQMNAGLHDSSARTVMTALRRIAAKGCTVVVSTQSMRDLAFVDQVVVIGSGGRVAYSGDPARLPDTNLAGVAYDKTASNA